MWNKSMYIIMILSKEISEKISLSSAENWNSRNDFR